MKKVNPVNRALRLVLMKTGSSSDPFWTIVILSETELDSVKRRIHVLGKCSSAQLCHCERSRVRLGEARQSLNISLVLQD